MTYKKPLKAFMATTLMGFTANAEDTADGKRIGSYAINALEAHETIEVEDADMKILVPFHAVKKAQYGISTANAERPDPYCDGGDDSKKYTVNVCGSHTVEDAVVGAKWVDICGEYLSSCQEIECETQSGWAIRSGDKTLISYPDAEFETAVFTQEIADQSVDDTLYISRTCV